MGSQSPANAEKTDDKKYVELVAEFENFEGKDERFTYRFRKPSPQQLSRANKEMQKNSERAFKNLTMQLVHPDDQSAYSETIAEYPGVATSYANEIYQRMGYGSLGK